MKAKLLKVLAALAWPFKTLLWPALKWASAWVKTKVPGIAAWVQTKAPAALAWFQSWSATFKKVGATFGSLQAWWGFIKVVISIAVILGTYVTGHAPVTKLREEVSGQSEALTKASKEILGLKSDLTETKVVLADRNAKLAQCAPPAAVKPIVKSPSHPFRAVKKAAVSYWPF